MFSTSSRESLCCEFVVCQYWYETNKYCFNSSVHCFQFTSKFFSHKLILRTKSGRTRRLDNHTRTLKLLKYKRQRHVWCICDRLYKSCLPKTMSITFRYSSDILYLSRFVIQSLKMIVDIFGRGHSPFKIPRFYRKCFICFEWDGLVKLSG